MTRLGDVVGFKLLQSSIQAQVVTTSPASPDPTSMWYSYRFMRSRRIKIRRKVSNVSNHSYLSLQAPSNLNFYCFLPPNLPANSALNRSSLDFASNPLWLLRSLVTSFVFPKYTEDSRFLILILHPISGRSRRQRRSLLHVFHNSSNILYMPRRRGQRVIHLGLSISPTL